MPVRGSLSEGYSRRSRSLTSRAEVAPFETFETILLRILQNTAEGAQINRSFLQHGMFIPGLLLCGFVRHLQPGRSRPACYQALPSLIKAC